MRNKNDTAPIELTFEGDIALVAIDNPPVNATSQAVREGLLFAKKKIDKSSAKTVLLFCKGRTFVAGGDVKEFDAPPVAPHLPDLINEIEMSNIPWVALIHGTCLGGGFELAMGCHYRLAEKSTRLGLPEVKIGLIPGATGTARLPRLIGIKPALDLITSGKMISADEALKLGAIDKIIEGDRLAFGKKFAKSILDKNFTKTAQRPIENNSIENGFFETYEMHLKKISRGLHAPLHGLQAVKNACTLPFSDAINLERQKFLALKESSQSKALRYVFSAERRVSKLEKIKSATPKPLEKIAIIGGGLMGAGIAANHLLAGFQITLIERDDEACQMAYGRVMTILKGAEARGKLPQDGAEKLMQKFAASSEYSATASCHLAIEAVFEDLSVKQSVFKNLANHMSSDAILATNTSYLDPEEIFQNIPNLERTLGLHFFSPAHVMKLLEIVEWKETTKDTLATAFALAKRLNKIGVRAGVCDGFIGNRILATTRRQADYLVIDGASPYAIDEAMRDFGMAMGPYQVQDMAGLQIGWANRKRQSATRDPKERYVTLADQLCEMERFGQKSGRGWYIYDEEAPRGRPDKAVLKLIDKTRQSLNITPKDFSKFDIQNSILAAMINEGAKIIEEKIATRPLDVDMVKLNGYGFPRWRGGPMYYADTIGLEQAIDHIKSIEAQSPNSWQVSNLILDLANQRKKFSDLNEPL